MKPKYTTTMPRSASRDAPARCAASARVASIAESEEEAMAREGTGGIVWGKAWSGYIGRTPLTLSLEHP
jgi:hypothetical protein